MSLATVALAIDDTKICQKPLFASLGVSSYFSKGGIEIRMRGDGKVHQQKGKPVVFRKLPYASSRQRDAARGDDPPKPEGQRALDDPLYGMTCSV